MESGIQKGNDLSLDKNTRSLMMKWLEQFTFVLRQLDNIQERIIPVLEADLKYEFRESMLVACSLIQSSVKSPFVEIKTHLEINGDKTLKEEDFSNIFSIGATSEVLALIGDAVLDLAVAQYLWKDYPEVGLLTKRRADLVCNENLARLCEKWDLYENRIHFDQMPPSTNRTLNHIKGGLVEAVFGVVYLEGGLSPVLNQVPLLVNIAVKD